MKAHEVLTTSLALALLASNPAWAEGEADPLSGWRFGGYSSASYISSPGNKDKASLDEISLLISWDHNTRWRFFSEIELERPASWQQGDSLKVQPRIDLERLYGEYSFSNQINLRAGRFLTPIGRWNQIHAAPLVWTTIRPMATQQLFPLNIDGVMLHGAMALDHPSWGEHTLEYMAYVETIPDMEQDKNEIKYQKSKGARLLFTGKVDIGISLAEFEEDLRNHPRYRLVGMDFVTSKNGWEASGEAYQRYQQGEDAYGGYLQGVAPLVGAWSALTRYERFQGADNISRERWLIGAAWKPRRNDILKIEYVGGDDNVPFSPKGFMASYAVLF